MKENCSIFIKFLIEEYIDDLLNGKLFMNSLEFFTDSESNTLKKGQRDSLEGKVPYNSITVRNGSTEAKITQYVSFGMEKYRVFCLMQLEPYRFCEKTNNPYYRFKNEEQYKQMLEFSEFCVVIKYPDEFVKRFQLACNKKHYNFCHSEVYYDRDTFLNQFVYKTISENHAKSIFYKNKAFELQQEYRFCLLSEVESDFTFLEIGSIKDIAERHKTSDFFNRL